MGRTSSRRVFVDALENIAAGIAESAGFALVTISVDLDNALETLAVAGDETARSLFLGRTLDAADVEKDLSNADHWGDLRFVPHHRHAWIATVATPTGDEAEPPLPPEDSGAWHPLDILLAPLYDDGGRLRGVISADLPRDERRPSAESITHLQSYVAQARRTVLYAMERLELDEQIRMTDAVRTVVREASSELSVDRIIDYCQEALTATFEASGIWLQTFDDDQDANGTIFSTNGADIHLREDLRRVARPAARLLWDLQQVAEIAESIPRSEAMAPDQEQQVFEFMRTIQITSMLFVPLGAGRECLGNLVLTREKNLRPWSALEKRTALDIGHDLGRALLNARSFERERQLVAELRELDSYKSRLIATLAHELKNPLTAILGHAEMLDSIAGLPAQAQNSVAAVERGAGRMQRLVEDLLALGKAGDPQVPFAPEPYDLRAGVEEMLDLLRMTIDRKALDVAVVGPASLVVNAERGGVDQVLANLISNATKYTPHGGRVTITLTSQRPRSGAAFAAIEVSDTGIGISEADQAHLFTEFFRSSNPAAVALPGTGLGLAIASRIVARHSGTLTCTSTLGEGTTFSVVLPGA